MTATPPAAGIAELGLQGWEGLTWTRVEIIGETPKKYRIRALQRTKLGGRSRWIYAGETALVPKHAIRAIALAAQEERP